MKRKLLIVIFIMMSTLCLLLLTGCNNENVNTNSSNNSSETNNNVVVNGDKISINGANVKDLEVIFLGGTTYNLSMIFENPTDQNVEFDCSKVEIRRNFRKFSGKSANFR